MLVLNSDSKLDFSVMPSSLVARCRSRVIRGCLSCDPCLSLGFRSPSSCVANLCDGASFGWKCGCDFCSASPDG